MSLILDALKKSEAERQRGQVPNLLSPSPTATAYYSAQKKILSALDYFDGIFIGGSGIRLPLHEIERR